MNKYPYYVATVMDAGILVKIFKDKKFKTYNDAVEATKKRYERLSKIQNRSNGFYELQIAILEYTEEYKGRIVTIFNNGDENEIILPKV